MGRSDVDLSLGHNRTETGRIRENLGALLQDEVYDLDSIVVTATCSPEGRWASTTVSPGGVPKA